jgi:hypothetical protein
MGANYTSFQIRSIEKKPSSVNPVRRLRLLIGRELATRLT